jgi:hypothetical protein
MIQDNTNAQHRIWHDSAHASLCALGVYLRRMDFFRPLEQGVHIRQKVLKYSSVQKLEMFFVGRLSGAKAVSHTATTVRVDPALSAAFGLPGCAEQSVIAQTLNAATEQDVADLQAAQGEIFGSYPMARPDGTTSNKSSWCSMWISHRCRQVSEQRGRNGATWGVAAPRSGANWYVCERLIRRKPSGRRWCRVAPRDPSAGLTRGNPGGRTSAGAGGGEQTSTSQTRAHRDPAG